jgi:lambda family phage portal protein
MALFDFLRNEQPVKKRTRVGRRMGRNYSGASKSRLFTDFIAPSNSADSNLKYQLGTLRDRSRDLARNNEYAKRFLNLIKTNVVGESGFTLQVRARNDDGQLDASGNTILENAFKAWGRMGSAEVSGRMSWLDCQRFTAEGLARDGEVFIKKIRNPRFRNGFTIQFIEPDLIDHEKNGHNEDNRNEIRMGVELDEFHRPVAYYILTDHPNDDFFGTTRSRKHIRVPADQIIHVFMPSRTYQTRGEPFMAPAIAGLKMLGGYREAELVAARSAAAKFGVITTPSGDEYVGDDETDDGVPIIDMEPGTYSQLPAGHEFQMIDPTHPTTAFADFESAVLRGIASGLNVSYTSLSNDLTGVSYSSIRQGTIEERDHYRLLQSFLIEHFCEPIFRSWLDAALDIGSIPIPINKFDKFSDNIHFRGRGFAWVDPQREISASVVGLQNGLLSMNDVAANYGRDVEELFTQIQNDKEMAERYGLKLAFEPFGGGQSAYGPMKINPEELGDTDGD